MCENNMLNYKFLRIKGCLIVLEIIRNFGAVRYTDIEVEYIKKTGRKLSPATLIKCLKDLEKNNLIHKSDDLYKISEEGKKLLLSLEMLSKKK
jgi:DNA-binding PadR family transcriptional regulator